MLRLLPIRGCRFFLCNNAEIERVTAARCMHIDMTSKYTSPRRRFALNTYKHSVVTNAFLVRYASTNNATEPPQLMQIPDPPKAVEQAGEVITYHASGEPTLESLGLGGWSSPTGIVQSCLEWLHVSLDLPWFAAIAAGTLVVRLALFPIMIKTQRNMAHMSHITPKLTELQEEMTDARRCGDYGKIVDCSMKMQKLYENPNFRPVQSVLLPFVQMPIFLSIFIGLRAMANLPVESLKTGGIWWFTDLTVPDPYYLLPIITSTTIYITFKLNAEVTIQQKGIMRYVPIILPLGVFPFMISFPAALPCYWTTTNMFTLLQATVLRTKVLRAYFNIPKPYEPPKKAEGKKSKSLIQGFKDSIDNVKFSKQVNDKLYADEITFKNAGLGTVPKTYPYDPTKQSSSAKLSKSKN